MNLIKQFATWFSENEGVWVKGGLELFREFIPFDGVTRPLGPCIYPQLPHNSVDCIYTIYI